MKEFICPRSIALADSVIEELKILYQKHNAKKSRVFASRTAFGQIDIKKAWKAALKRAEIEDCRATRYSSYLLYPCSPTRSFKHGASNCYESRTLNMLQHYTHLDVKVTKKFSKNISEQILQGVRS